jgi:transcriptional regulator with XRE-family HTH domain
VDKKLNKLSDQVRRAVDDSSLSRYAICKAIGMDQSVMSRFMSGKGGLSMETLDALADLLNLQFKPTTNASTGQVKHGKHRE